MKVGIVGLGNFGTSLAQVSARNKNPTIVWDHLEEVMLSVEENRENDKYLPGVALDPLITPVHDLAEVASVAEVLIFAQPTRYCRAAAQKIKERLDPKVLLLSASKGLEEGSGLTSSQLLADEFSRPDIAVLSGPTIAEELVNGTRSAAVVACERNEVSRQIIGILESEHFHLYPSSDVRGTELGGVLKNIYALGFGILSGWSVKPGRNLVGMYLSLAHRELERVGLALGGEGHSLRFLAGLGDLITTSLSTDSHHYQAGVLCAQGKSMNEIEEIAGHLPEGIKTLSTLIPKVRAGDLRAPLANAIFKAFSKETSPEALVKSLVVRRSD